MDADDAWFHDSFSVDPWATAQELLAIADELREAGVAHRALADSAPADVGSGGDPSPRIAGMTRVAEEAEAVAGGTPDRFARVLEELHRPEEERIAVVSDLEISVDLPYDYLTPIWQAVFDALRRCGGAVSFADAASLSGDGPEVTILRTGDEWEAAEYVAAYLSANLEDGPQSEPTREESGVALLIEADATALDHTLSKRGLPLTGATLSSSARWELQLLPAFLSTFWTPVDPHAIAAFLSLASGVVRKDVASAILWALQEHPGVGGPKWRKAMQKIGNAVDEAEADRLDRFFSRELFDEERGIPLAALSERLTYLRRRLAIRLDSSELAAVAITQTQQLEGALGRLFSGSEARVSRTFLERMLRTVVRPVALGEREGAAPWRVYRNLESVPPKEKLLLWWSPTDPQGSGAARFTGEEIQILGSLGYTVEESAQRRRRHRYYARKFLTHGPEKLLILLADRLRGEPAEPHPLVEELRSTAGKRVTELDSRESAESIPLPRKRIALEAVARELPAEAPVTIGVSSGAIGYPKRLSYSSIRSLLGCPMQWSLSEHAGVGRTYGVSLPRGNQMLGTLTHRIVELLITENLKDGALPDRTERLAGELFDRLLPTMAAELALPGRHLARKRHRATVVRAVAALRDSIEALGLSVVAVERFLKATWRLSVGDDRLEIELVGPADMELADAQGRPFVLDLKFSYSQKHYVDSLERGEAIQLATYAWLIEQDRGESGSGTGYFLLPTRRLVTSSQLAGSGAISSARPTVEVWKRTGRSVAAALDALHQKGEVLVTGLLEREEGSDPESRRAEAEAAEELYQAPPCKFCDFSLICGLKRGDA
jgi:hypothetical protein